jgi:hypothetical protein
MLDITKIIDNAYAVVKNHEMETPGQFRRWNWQDPGSSRDLGVNEYGCADASNILYMIGRFPSQPQERAMYIKALQDLQDPTTGMFVEATHHSIHTTAHCIAAIELFDAKAKHPLKDLHFLLEKEALYKFMDELDWAGLPWIMSHRGAGLYAALVLQDEVDRQWQGWYFDWLNENADPQSGFFRKGAVQEGKKPLFHHLAGTFHYLFNMEYARQPLRYPDKLIDSCLSIWEDLKKKSPDELCLDYNNRWENLSKSISFAEIDWVYCVTRALRQSGHRFAECKAALREFAGIYINWLNSLDHFTHDDFNDLHQLFGCICALAELQTALPGEIYSEKPLKLVLDRRPFI